MITLANIANPTTLIVLLVIGILLFGANKIPEMFKGLGSGMREFKKGLNEDERDTTTDKQKTDKPA